MISIYAFRREWDAWNLKVMLPGAALGMGAGWLFAAHVSDVVATADFKQMVIDYIEWRFGPTAHSAPSEMLEAFG